MSDLTIKAFAWMFALVVYAIMQMAWMAYRAYQVVGKSAEARR